MEKVKVYKIGEAVERSNNGNKTLVGLSELAGIISNDGNTVLFIENDACHFISDMPETIKLGLVTKKKNIIALIPDSFIYPTTEWVIKNVESYEVELPEWIHCFGIKGRIRGNCRLLADTLKSFNVEPSKYLGENF